MYDLQSIRWDSLQIGRELGKGGFATVYLGRWQGNEVAVKQLNVSSLPGELNTDFVREANIHAQCNFPRIVRLFGITQEPGHFALIMEYLPKGSLYDVLHEPTIELPWFKRWEMAIDVGTGLAYLHGAKILHQDLKSLNVLLDADLRAKLSDFGQSKIKTHTASTTAQAGSKAAGTIRWRAPESFKRGFKFNEAADVYSYGMILWELASRALPFADETDNTIVMGWIKDDEKETIPADCPAEYAAAITAAWQPATGRPSAEALAGTLERHKPAMLGDTPYTAHPARDRMLHELDSAAHPAASAVFSAPSLDSLLSTTPAAAAPMPAKAQAAPAMPAAAAAMAALSLAPAPNPALQAQVNQLILHVARGEQDAAETMVRTNPNLLLHQGQVTDYSNRTFKNITAFQYALWAYDWHMWEMLLRYLPKPTAYEQLQDLERHGTEHGKHYDARELLQALQTHVDNHQSWTSEQRTQHWCKVVGKAQTLVPAHVAHEYCRPDRPFEPTPTFTEPTLPRVLTFEDYSSGSEYYSSGSKVMANWFPLGGSLGSSCALLRMNGARRARGSRAIGGHWGWPARDLSALTALYKTRTTQYATLQKRLR